MAVSAWRTMQGAGFQGSPVGLAAGSKAPSERLSCAFVGPEDEQVPGQCG